MLVPLQFSYLLFRLKGIVMPARRKGSSSATTRNERRRDLRKSFKKKMEAQELKVVKLEQTVRQLRRSQRLKTSVTSRLLPNFPCKAVQHLSAGSVRPLLNHPAKGMTISTAPYSVLLFLFSMHARVLYQILSIHLNVFPLLDWLGKGTFGTCQLMWYAGMNVAVKTPHHQSIRERNILMEAKMLEVSILLCHNIYLYSNYWHFNVLSGCVYVVTILCIIHMLQLVAIYINLHCIYSHACSAVILSLLQCCSGHPNTPLFFSAVYGLVADVLPSLVMSVSTVDGFSLTL